MKGLGNDIISIERIRQINRRYGTRFSEKILTKKELLKYSSYPDPSTFLAGRFTAKEAIAKALGTGFGKDLKWIDIEISNDEKGRPYPLFSKKIHRSFLFPKILISISHCKEYASAVAIWYE